MRFQYILGIFLMLMGLANAQELLKPSSKEQFVYGKWNLEGGGELNVIKGSQNNSIITTDMGVSLSLAPHRNVRQIYLVPESNTILALVFRRRGAHPGLFYDHLLVVSREQNIIEFRQLMTAVDLLEIDGRRRTVHEIVDGTKYPNVTLKISTYEKPTTPTMNIMDLETWDVEDMALKGRP